MPAQYKNDFSRLDKRDIANFMLAVDSKRPQSPDGQCPDEMEMAALMAGDLNPPERRRLWSHLRSCPDCYELFSDSMETWEEASSYGDKKSAFLKKYFWPLPAAVAAAVIFFLFFTFPKTPDWEAEMSGLLNSSHIERMSKAFTAAEPEPRALGFHGATSTEQVVFNLGVALAELEIVLATHNYYEASALMDDFIKSLQILSPPTALSAQYKELKTKLDNKILKSGDRLLTPALKNFLQDKNQSFFLYFGRWLQAGRAAALSRNRQFYTEGTLDYLIKQSEKRGLPRGVKQNLNKVKSALQKQNLGKAEFQKLTALFERILLVLGRE